ncbi:MAG: hypothetical protein HYX66_03710 [Ignavibacteria bacterium]|nr:hypothetical protein [Ignavibacteria bacterium]
MTLIERVAQLEYLLRPLLSTLPPSLTVKVFSRGRRWFVERFAEDDNTFVDDAPHRNSVKAWNLLFNRPIWNAAGMFKSGAGYSVVSRQGAGAFVGGTTTSRPRIGNRSNGYILPAVPYSRSASASNWLGLPNQGHAAVAKRLAAIEKVHGCPVGISVAAEPGLHEDDALPELVEGMFMFHDAGVDYIELNESCPNVEQKSASLLDEHLINRLEYVSHHFLEKRERPLPVVVKFSVDTDARLLPELIQTLATLSYDGIILGNTSTLYKEKRERIAPQDRAMYDFFTNSFGGGLSGAVVKQDSLDLAKRAVEIVNNMYIRQEFHVIRCGGVSSAADITVGQQHGILLNQWYTGYFERFAKYGHAVYKNLDA